MICCYGRHCRLEPCRGDSDNSNLLRALIGRWGRVWKVSFPGKDSIKSVCQSVCQASYFCASVEGKRWGAGGGGGAWGASDVIWHSVDKPPVTRWQQWFLICRTHVDSMQKPYWLSIHQTTTFLKISLKLVKWRKMYVQYVGHYTLAVPNLFWLVTQFWCHNYCFFFSRRKLEHKACVVFS